MQRTTISLPEDTIRRLRLLAAERGTSMAALIREAIHEKAAGQSLGVAEAGPAYAPVREETPPMRPQPRSIGMSNSGQPGVARTLATDRVPPHEPAFRRPRPRSIGAGASQPPYVARTAATERVPAR